MIEALQGFSETPPIGWLLDGESFVRYRTLIDLLDRDKDDEQVVAARRSLSRDLRVKRIFDQQNSDGYWGTPGDIYKWWPRKDTTFWVLGVLSDFGFTRRYRKFAAACEYVFSTQLPSGAFGWGQPAVPGDCFTGILTESLFKSGYSRGPRLKKAYEWLMQRQRLDGGFWCKKSGQPGGPREKEPSCAFGTLCVLAALAQNPDLKGCAAATKAGQFLLGCWDRRGKVKYAGHDSQIGTGWERLKYPFTDYRILKYLDAMSRVDGVKGDARLDAMMNLVISKRDEASRFTPESIHKAWSSFDFGQKIVPSRWLTLIAYRIVKRMGRVEGAS